MRMDNTPAKKLEILIVSLKICNPERIKGKTQVSIINQKY